MITQVWVSKSGTEVAFTDEDVTKVYCADPNIEVRAQNYGAPLLYTEYLGSTFKPDEWILIWCAP